MATDDLHYPSAHHVTKLDLTIAVPSLRANPYVRTFECPTSGFIGFSYTDITKITWDPFTMAARGLIVKPLEDGTFEPVALPFPKFENWGKEIADIHEGERGPVVSVTAKMDGSLGIIFWDDVQGRWRVSTRGSFAEKSAQAAWAEKILREHHGSFAEADKAYTYLVEIICEESIVVVPYKTEDHGLILLSAYHVASGLELRRPHLEAHGARLSMKVVAESPLGDVKEILETTKTLNGLEQEGWVVRFANGERRKFKGEDYKRLHRLHSGFNPMALWVNLSWRFPPSPPFAPRRVSR